MAKKTKFGINQINNHAPKRLKRLRNTIVFMAGPTVLFLKNIGVDAETVHIVSESFLYLGSILVGITLLTGQEETIDPDRR